MSPSKSSPQFTTITASFPAVSAIRFWLGLVCLSVVIGLSPKSVNADQSDGANQPVVMDETGVSVFPSNSTSADMHHATWQQQVTTLEAAPGYQWRKTSEGWQQIPFGNIPQIHRLQLPSYEPAIHPLSITAMMVLLSLAAMAWVSNEWDWERFVGNQ